MRTGQKWAVRKHRSGLEGTGDAGSGRMFSFWFLCWVFIAASRLLIAMPALAAQYPGLAALGHEGS